ncbi:hypothetical protein [Lederbergia citri]|uniref:Uncharacterized protein n=1 Tax=Lederbergia citri TaxID=2833580 RepID=A0A942TFP5_9BACI|nr:hypothetical protein [Lederbergia citri]MBS4195314.1 hypothetical protein [Lederbergia citri]
MFYYLINKVGDGTRNNPYRPDFDGAYVWNPDHICNTCGTYIIATSEQKEHLQEVTDIEQACEVRGLKQEEVINWFVGDS